ncbi:GWT1-domain-containing protein [Kockovaella imperatae]|uniref:GPI-anchored wall transfer protein n=1 Tax=Kockovaella imperatae TaxID=4999 RepID=A0A1Y1UT16_9TREE|nr:GWT1-domain-containing protein [Kockovaella imperatae]ORX40674.1 GWT1-domain-containing protein [Kockovaella imperatae]
MSQKPWRRRHNPTPSTHTHTAIDILPTPELPSSSSRSSSLLSESNDPTSSSEQSPGQVSVPGAGDKLSFLSVYRAHMMIMTVHCILAVDFPVFPRRQGKCEDFGASLMDVGVGSFVFSLGLVSARKLVGSQVSNDNIFLKISQSIWKSLPTLVLGLVRVLMVKGSEYPEHVTEYGVHWNFFFTLAILPVIGISLRPVCQLVGWTQAGLLVAVLHQSALSSSGFNLQSWILSPDRNGLIEMNKEGLVSLPGYLAIYLLGVAIGQHVMRAAAPAKRVESATEKAEERIKRHYEQRRANLAMELVSFGLGWWSLLAFSRFMGVEVSRRMANSAYVLWVAGYNTLFLLGYLLLEIYLLEIPVPPHAVPPLLDAINRNGLMVFLIANLLTGVVNLSFKTMYLSNYQAMCILILYSIAVSAIAWTARYWKVNL